MTEDLRAKTCCFTGHRRIPEEALPRLERRLNEELEALAARGVIYFGAGGALGFDTLAAQAVLYAKRTHPEIALSLILPCRDQDLKWPENHRRTYRAILEQADSLEYVAEDYQAGCMQARNRRLVEGSQLCVCCLLPGKRGGTLYTVQYARKLGVPVRNLCQSPV